MENPFLLFPLEVWEMILDRVYDSETVYKVLQIFPQLDVAVQKKKHQWLLGKILPFIITRTRLLKEKELLKCRLGCKNWIKQVDNFLKNQQPQLRPFHLDLQSEDQFSWNYEAQFREQQHLNEKNHFGRVKFEVGGGGYKSVRKFLEQIEIHPEKRNPFLARSLSVRIWLSGSSPEDYKNMIEFLDMLTKVLEKFGKDIWFYAISANAPIGCQMQDQIRKHTWDWLIESLGLLPNLKSFGASGDFLRLTAITLTGSPFMNLSSLESIKVSGGGPGPSPLAFHLLSNIRTPIRRLVLRFSEWRNEYRGLLSTVTEFKLEEIRTEGDRPRLKNILSGVEAPQLVKLELEFKGRNNITGRNHPPYHMEEDIFPWIKRFPSLKYFTIGNLYGDPFIQEKGILLPERDSPPNLQFLSIRDSFALSYNFLLCLPSLQHLQIYTDSQSKVVDLSNEKVVRIREQIETGTLHKSNIWDLLPTLKTVSILSQRYKGRYVCDREKVNYSKEHPDYQGFGDFWGNARRQRRRRFEGMNELNILYGIGAGGLELSSDSEYESDDENDFDFV